MIYLLLSIFFSTITVSLFKVFEYKKVDTFQAIVFNYLTCSIMGNLLSPQTIFAQQVWIKEWFPYVVVLGLLFITIFNFIAQTVQKIGVPASMVAAKLSVAIPVLGAVILYHEPAGLLKFTGIFISMLAVYFISKKEDELTLHLKKLWYLPVVVFIGSGFIDTLLNYVEQTYIPPADAASIICTVFTVAFISGAIYLMILIEINKTKLSIKNIAWGFVLGVPNYFSMFFLVKTLEKFHGSYIFPLNNIAIVATSTLVAVLAFNEKLSVQNKAGLILAMISILLISFT